MATVNVNIQAADLNRLQRVRGVVNKKTAARVGLPPNATDAQVKAINPALTIYADAPSFGTYLLLQAIDSLIRIADDDDVQTFRAAWASAPQATRDAIDSQLGLPAGSNP